MEVIRDKQAMRSWSRSRRKEGCSIALVPTMGFLHDGHLSLVREAKRRADAVVVSIYVNPSQFAPGEDLSTYPRNFDGDLKMLEPLGVDAIFNPHDLYVRESKSIQRPSVDDVRQLITPCQITEPTISFDHVDGQGHETWIRVERLEVPLCGKSRPIFFKGVATVVAKLFNIVEPDMAIFGKKDYQQWCLIRRMVRDLDFAVDIIGCELLREADGLAMSSRNVRLSPEERVQALSISRSLKQVEAAVRHGSSIPWLKDIVDKAIREAGGKIDYIEIVEQKSLGHLETINCPAVMCVAAWFGSVRLIDNIELQPS